MSQPNVDRELQRLLDATRVGTEPDSASKARLRAALAVGLASSGAAKAVAGTRLGLGAKLWLISAGCVALALCVLLLRSPAPAPATAAPPAPESNSVPTGSLAPLTPAAPPAAASLAVTSPSSPVFTPSRVPSQASAAPARSAAKTADPADELALVSSMQLALRSGNALQALALASEHARRFPSGALAQEREGARAIARCQLAPEAQRAPILAAFQQRYAGSPYAARVQAACSR